MIHPSLGSFEHNPESSADSIQIIKFEQKIAISVKGITTFR